MAELQPRHLRSRTEQGVLVLSVTVPHLRGDTLVAALQQELLTVVSQDEAPKVVLDLQRVTSLASEAFRPLLALRRKLQERGGRLVLCNLNAGVDAALRATRLMSSSRSSTASFEAHPDVAAAVASLSSPAAQQ